MHQEKSLTLNGTGVFVLFVFRGMFGHGRTQICVVHVNLRPNWSSLGFFPGGKVKVWMDFPGSDVEEIAECRPILPETEYL